MSKELKLSLSATLLATVALVAANLAIDEPMVATVDQAAPLQPAPSHSVPAAQPLQLDSRVETVAPSADATEAEAVSAPFRAAALERMSPAVQALALSGGTAPVQLVVSFEQDAEPLYSRSMESFSAYDDANLETPAPLDRLAVPATTDD